MGQRFRRPVLLILVVLAVATGLVFAGGVVADSPTATASNSSAQPSAAANDSVSDRDVIAPSLRDRIGSGDVEPTGDDEMVPVSIHTGSDTGTAVESLVEEHDGENVYRQGTVAHATLPSTAIGPIAETDAVQYVREPAPLEPAGTVSGDDISEGVEVMGADHLHQQGITGSDTTVAVVDTSFNLANPKYEDQVVDTWGDNFHYDERGTHGTASAEVVADVAPDADLVLVAVGNEQDIHQAIDYIDTSTETDIVTMSLGFAPSAGPLDGTDPISEHIDEVTDDGTVWFNAAGNQADRKSWHGTFTDTRSDDIHEFDPGGDRLRVSGSGSLFVSWDTDWRVDDQWYAVHLYEVGGDEPIQTSYTPTPVEAVTIPNYLAEAEVEIERVDADGSQEFVVSAWGDLALEDHWTPGKSISIPATGDATTAVGAVHHWDDRVAAYSSRGPTIDERRGIDLTAPSAVSQYERTQPYAGTSAASPHAAGAGALVLEAGDDLTTSAALEYLTATARPLAGEDDPPNAVVGHGYVDAHAAATEAMPVTCGTIDDPGVVELEDDLTGSDDCLTITADDVTLDGNGHTIAGAGDGSAVRLDGAGGSLSNVTVTDVTIADWHRPIETTDGADVNDVEISEVTFRNVTGAATIDGGTDVTVSAVDIEHVGTDDADALSVRGVTDLDLTDVHVAGTHRDGVALRSVSSVTMTDVTVESGREGAGLRAVDVDTLTVTGGTFAGSTESDVRLEGSEDLELSDVALDGTGELHADGGTAEVDVEATTIGNIDDIAFAADEVTVRDPETMPDAPEDRVPVTDHVEIVTTDPVTLSVPYSTIDGQAAERVTVSEYDGSGWIALETAVDSDTGMVSTEMSSSGIVAGHVDDERLAPYRNDEGEVTIGGVLDAIADWQDGTVDIGLVLDAIDAWQTS